MIDNPIRILQKQTWWSFIYQPGSRSPPPGFTAPSVTSCRISVTTEYGRFGALARPR